MKSTFWRWVRIVYAPLLAVIAVDVVVGLTVPLLFDSHDIGTLVVITIGVISGWCGVMWGYARSEDIE